ncbi:Hypothetical protein SRAE_2000042800 [Strongyloides ratti]|uniref:Uncharacterized protein n=1 Tax=Strongyloides ratti TaxID=34506 RepID=A0A090L7Q4_STRRB|nr:Hypothetical protein SRAE_2000042800 [Strongyloides ratti]CEF65752.1 Hypothetical protein SRAE_2000042800 [Strongyloides ratti]
MLLNSLKKSIEPVNFIYQSVRHNCPWHRSNFTQSYFPFHMKPKLRWGSFEARQKTYGGRLMTMRRVLREQTFLGWNHDTKIKNQKLETPL